MIRPATLADMPRAYALMRELAIYERAEDAVRTTVADFERDFTDGIFQCIVAEDAEGTVQGFALFYIAYSTWKGKMLYLEDLLVTESLRGKGMGRNLFDAVIAAAKTQQCRMMKWQVLDWNEPAIHFYQQAFGADIEKGWYNGRLFFE